MAYIESHQELGRHPKTEQVAELLSISVPAVMGHLHLLWHWALDFAQDGDISEFSHKVIAKKAMWDGDPDALVDALLNCGTSKTKGFLERTTDGRLLIHDWYDYAGKLVEKRKANAARMREKRSSINEQYRDDSGICDEQNTNVQNTCDARAGANVEKRNVENLKTLAESCGDAKEEISPEQEFAFTFWPPYPNKKAKPDALKAFIKARKRASLDAIMAGLSKAKASYEWTKDAGEFIPYPASWLNDDGWENEYRSAADRASPQSKAFPGSTEPVFEARRPSKRPPTPMPLDEMFGDAA
jgi:hypothetical protein